MMKQILPILLLVIVSCAQLFSRCMAAETGWILDQETGLNGHIRILLSAKGMRLVGDKGGYVIVMKAPAWKVQLFSDGTRAFYESDPAKFKAQLSYGLGLVSGARFSGLKKVGNAMERVEGFNCKRVSLDSGHPLPANVLLLPTEQRRKLSKDGQMCRSLDFWTTSDLPVPHAAAAVVERLHQLPEQEGFPIQLKFINENGKHRTELSTKSRRAEVPDSLFSVPSGYHKVASEAEVMIDAKKQAVLDDLLQSIDAETARK